MITLFTVAILIPIITFIHFYTYVNALFDVNEKTVELSLNNTKNSTTTNFILNDAIISDNITNILLVGTDARNNNESGRSDSMIIATLDEKHKKIKLTSLARDTLVEIPGHGEEKLNHAYSYGGVDLLISTIEHNLQIDISNYVTVDFNSFANIINALGGVTIDVKIDELKELNKFIPECFEFTSNKNNTIMKLIEAPGVQKLNGYQALSYSRIRKNDSAIERDNRQKKVLQALLNELSDISVLEIPKVINAILPYIKSNLSFSDIIKLSKQVLKIGNFQIEQINFPSTEYSVGGTIKNKGWVLKFEKDKCLPILHKFIFGDDEILN